VEEGWEKAGRPASDRRERWRELKKANGDRERSSRTEGHHSLRMAATRFQGCSLQGFFPDDGYFTDGWHHVMEGESSGMRPSGSPVRGRIIATIRDFTTFPPWTRPRTKDYHPQRDPLEGTSSGKIKPERLPPSNVAERVPPPLQPSPGKSAFGDDRSATRTRRPGRSRR